MGRVMDSLPEIGRGRYRSTLRIASARAESREGPPPPVRPTSYSAGLIFSEDDGPRTPACRGRSGVTGRWLVATAILTQFTKEFTTRGRPLPALDFTAISDSFPPIL